MYQFFLPLFWIGLSTQSVYKTHVSPSCYTNKIKCTADSLLRRYSDNCEVSTGTDSSKGCIDFSIAKSGLPDKFREISIAFLPEDRVFGDSCELQSYDTHCTTRESKCNDKTLSVVSLKRASDSEVNFSTDWETMLLCSSSSASHSPLQVPTNATGSGDFKV